MKSSQLGRVTMGRTFGLKDVKIDGFRLSPEEAALVTRLLTRLVENQRDPVADFSQSVKELERFEPPEVAHDPYSLVQAAQQVYLRRRARAKFLPASFFGEPAWDMFLGLYVVADGGSRQTVSRIIEFAWVAPTTALRWLSALENAGYVARKPCPLDARVVFIHLTTQGRQVMDTYLGTLIENELL